MKKVLIILAFIITSLFVYGRYFEIHNFKVNEYAITNNNLSASFDGFKIVHFSDLLYNETTTEKDIEKIFKKINELKADIIVFTGDLIEDEYTLSTEEQNNLIEKLKNLNCTLYKYAIIGDNDNKKIDQYKQILDEANFRLLNNTKEYIFYHDLNPIKIMGTNDLENIDDLLTDEENIKPIYTILLTHYPSNIEKLSNYNFDLILAGHSLGGIIKVPFYGSILRKENVNKYYDSYYKINNSDVYISNGLGSETFSYRLFNSPSINIYRLKK